jgi:pyruvate formate lyase activating enzyme
MKIGGFLRFSLIDFPGKVAAVIFTQGCNFRCPFCHNPELVLPRRFQLPVPEAEVLELLKKRFGKLDGVAITGGEPLIQQDLEEFIFKIKQIGYQVKIDTNGSYPAILKKLIRQNLIDYIAMDIKAALTNYPKVIDTPVNLDYILRSIQTIRESGLPYEFRTTIVKNLHTIDDINEIARLLQPEDRFVLQNFRPAKRVGHKDLPLAAFEAEELAEFQQILSDYNLNFTLR